jgi:hypothetical protein
MTPAGAAEVGRRVFLRAPAARARDEFLALMSASRRFLRPWPFAGQGYMSEGLRLPGSLTAEDLRR